MNKKIIILIIGILSLIVLIFIILNVSNESADITDDTGSNFPNTNTTNVSQPDPILRDTINSYDSKYYSALSLKNHSNTELISDDGYYGNTADSKYYEILFFEPTGSITVLLYNEDLKLSRDLAELQLKNVLPYTEEEICKMDIRVAVNKMVSEEYANIPLGLSFCPLSIDL